MLSFAPSAAPRFAHDAPLTVDLPWLRRQFGVVHYSAPRMVKWLGGLVADHGFPAPLPSLHGGRTIAAVHSGSLWLRDAVEAWLYDRLPPAGAAALDAAATRAAASDLDAAATTLRLVQGGRP